MMEVPEAVERTLASLPERVRRLRWADAVAWRMGPEDFMDARGDCAPAREERLRRRRGRESSAAATEMDGSTWDSSACDERLLREVAGAPVGVVSSGARLATAARGVVGEAGRGVCARPGACGARRPEEKNEEYPRVAAMVLVLVVGLDAVGRS